MKEREEFLDAVFKKTKDFMGMPTYGAFGDGKWFYTARPISWVPEPDYPGELNRVDVPIGFVTDLTSTPRAFWAAMPRDGKYLAAAIIHDFCYWEQAQNRENSDEIFNLGMLELGVNYLSRKLIYKAVRIAGSRAWKKNRKLKLQGEKRFITQLPDKPTITWKEWQDR